MTFLENFPGLYQRHSLREVLQMIQKLTPAITTKSTKTYNLHYHHHQCTTAATDTHLPISQLTPSIHKWPQIWNMNFLNSL